MRAENGNNLGVGTGPTDKLESPIMENLPRTGDTGRVIHVPLSEADWKAFMATTPQPISWLKERIQEAIASAAAADAKNKTS
jgi:hypothetical protein